MFHLGATHILRTFFAGNIGSHRCSDPSAVWTVRFLHRYTDRYNNKKHDSAITELDDARIRNSLGSCLALRNSPAIELYRLLGNISEKKTIANGLGCDFIFAHVAQTTKMLPRCQGVIDFRQDGIKFHWIIKLRQYTATYWCNEYQTSAKICNLLIHFYSKVLCEVSTHRNGH